MNCSDQMMMQMNMNDCIIKSMTVNNYMLLFQEGSQSTNIIVIDRTTGRARFLKRESDEVGVKIEVVDVDVPHEKWNVEMTNGLMAISTTDTDLLWTVPTDGSQFLTLQNRMESGNKQQFFKVDTVDPLGLYQLIIQDSNTKLSLQTPLPTVNTFIVIPTSGTTVYDATFANANIPG